MRASRIVYILRQVCDSLAEAHASGMTHRDIKPRNIFLCRMGVNYDCVKVLDFGLVKLRSSGDQSKLTREGITAGTPAYMSPEMAMGHRNVDARSDVYALGCVAYFLVTGQLVFDSPNALSMALDHVQKIPQPPSERSEVDVPPELDRLILRCLAKKPEDRPQSARELKQLLDTIRFPEVWHNDRAEEWWQAHLPTISYPVNVEERVSSGGTTA